MIGVTLSRADLHDSFKFRGRIPGIVIALGLSLFRMGVSSRLVNSWKLLVTPVAPNRAPNRS
eukprot:4052349-Pyramimonas_sp.AAC.1